MAQQAFGARLPVCVHGRHLVETLVGRRHRERRRVGRHRHRRPGASRGHRHRRGHEGGFGELGGVHLRPSGTGAERGAPGRGRPESRPRARRRRAAARPTLSGHVPTRTHNRTDDRKTARRQSRLKTKSAQPTGRYRDLLC